MLSGLLYPGLLLPLVLHHHLRLPGRLLLPGRLVELLLLPSGVLLPVLLVWVCLVPERDLLQQLLGGVRELRLRPVPELRDLDGL